MTNAEKQQEALSRALASHSLSNYAAIFTGFADKGITDIRPRENVFTFQAWKAKGRQVRAGQHGVKICTYVPMTNRQTAEDRVSDTKPNTFRRPRMVTVFHVSQTDAIT